MFEIKFSDYVPIPEKLVDFFAARASSLSSSSPARELIAAHPAIAAV